MKRSNIFRPNFLRSLLTIALFLTGGSVYGQQNAVTINVKDPNGGVVPGARVTVRSRSGTELSSITAANGDAQFEAVESGDYLVVVTAGGFSQTAREAQLGGANTSLDISLSVGTINESVTTTATRTQVTTDDTAVPVTVVGRDQLEREPVNTVGDIFRSLPGTSTTNEGAFQVRPRIRGLESNRILILVDGERLNNARTSTSQSGIEIGLVDVDNVETVEVVRGAGSVLYGTDALAGTINLITRNTPKRGNERFRLGGMFNGYYSSNERGRRGNLAVTGSDKRLAFRVSQSLERYANYKSGDTTGVPDTGSGFGFVSKDEVGNSQSHGSSTQATLRLFFDDKNDLKLNYEGRRAADIGSPLLTFGFGFNAYFPYSNRDKFAARFETRNVTEYLASVSASVFVQNQDRNFTNVVLPVLPFFGGNFSETTTKTRTTGFDIQSNWLLGSKNFLTTGVSYFRDGNQDTRLSQRLAPPIVPNRAPSVPRSDYGGMAFFAQDEFTLTSRLKFIGGVRTERFSTSSMPTEGFVLPAGIRQFQLVDIGAANVASGAKVKETAVTGDFGAVFKLTNNVSLTGRVGRSFRVANLFERFFTGAGSIGGFVIGNPNIKPERGINVDVGAKFRFARAAGSFTYFNNTYRDFLSTQPVFDRRGCPVVNKLTPPPLADSVCQVTFSATVLQVQQTVNFARVRLQGFEAEVESPFRIGDFGFLTAGGNISYLRGQDLQADAPFNVVPKLKTVAILRWNDAANRYYAEGQTRIVNKQDRLTQNFRTSNLGDEPGYAVTDIRGGYNFRREHYRFGINAGVTNLFDRYYSEQFVLAPARGRSFVIGTTIELF